MFTFTWHKGEQIPRYNMVDWQVFFQMRRSVKSLRTTAYKLIKIINLQTYKMPAVTV